MRYAKNLCLWFGKQSVNDDYFICVEHGGKWGKKWSEPQRLDKNIKFVNEL